MRFNKIACITGASGQDGSYLSKLLLNKNYLVIAADRRNSRDNMWRHKYLGINNNPNLIYEDFDLTDNGSILRLFQKYKINEFYNLAAQSFVKSSFQVPMNTANSTALGVLRILEIIRNFYPKVRFYQASSSEMFGKTYGKKQNEKTIFYPRSTYAVSKVFAHDITVNYRESYNLFLCSGILFNHESPLRGEEFVTRKISKSICEYYLGKKKYFELGNLDARRDWGFAEDYVEAMWKMLQIKKPNDYVIGTGISYSVRDFLNECCNYLNLKVVYKNKGTIKEVAINKDTGKIFMKINKKFFRPTEVDTLRADFQKAKKTLHWKPKTSFKILVKKMMDSDFQEIRKSID